MQQTIYFYQHQLVGTSPVHLASFIWSFPISLGRLTPITNYNNIDSSSARMNSSSFWEEDFSYLYKIQDEHGCRRLISILEDAYIQHFDMEASFMQEYQLIDFENQWALQNNANQGTQYKGMKVKTKYYLQRPSGYPYEFIMDLGSNDAIRGWFFMEVYRDELERMKEEYNIKISTNGHRLYIFMREQGKLNFICQTRLMDMNRSLRMFYGHEPNLVFIINKSFMLRKQLRDKGINVWFKRMTGSQLAVFFSVTLDIPQMVPIIEQITKFDISVFNLLHKSISEEEAFSIKNVIQEALKQDIAVIQQEYEIKIEFSQDNSFIVFHTRHAIFGAQPVTVFQKRLNSLVILSVKSKHIKEFDNKIRKFIKEVSFITEAMNKKRNQTYICIDLAKIHGKDAGKNIGRQVEEFLKHFLLLIEPKFEIKIYFNHMAGELEKCFTRITQLFEDNNLIIKNHEFYEKTQRKAILQLKDLSQNVLKKRQTELLLFLHSLLAVPSGEQSSQVNILDEASLMSLSNSINSSQYLNGSKAENSVIDEKFELSWLKVSYVEPKLFKNQEGDDWHYRKDRRKRQLQNLMNAQSAFKFKVWSIELSSELPIPKGNISAKPYLFRNIFKDNKINDANQPAILNSYQVDQYGAIGFATEDVGMPVIPLYALQRIQ